MKFKSSRLKEFDYVLQSLNFDEARTYGEIISLSDNQILRSIRDIKGTVVDHSHLEELFKTRDKITIKPKTKENIKVLSAVQRKINAILFIPEYITIVMEHPSHYKYLFENGLLLNGRKFIRFSCSAGQARNSTVVFCEEETAKDLRVRLDNGRNLNMKLTPSKFNAYLGVSGSATKVVSSPRFCVVSDYEKPMDMTVNFVTETDLNEDDIIEIKTVNQMFNRFDGQGLISYEKAAEWAQELGLDYVPAQWCIRQNYVKGMLCTFDIHKFCKVKNNENYNIRTSYKDESGNNKIVDLRECDLILSESQFKLWDSFNSVEEYQANCLKNKLDWGVSIYTPKQDNDILRLNYQFIQTLNWNKQDIERACEKFVDWITGLNSNNIYYALLFLIGEKVNEEKIKRYLQSSENYWVKSLILNHDLIKDKYIQNKIYDLIKTRIQQGCLGEIIVDGNFQTIVSDPYAQMQHICGLEVTGLLNQNEYYSNYWNNKGISMVDSMRAPLTFRSEHLKLNLINNAELSEWYKHCYTGIIVNVFGKETVHWSGSDFDMDILATTSDSNVIKGVFDKELPVAYDPPKPKKINISDLDLYNADLFAFGSAIGSITNKSTSGFALLPLFSEDSIEYKTIMNRLKMCTKLQSAQIDKAKIGRNVKGIPQNWIMYSKIMDEDDDETKKLKELNNSILLDKHPYFFIYLYKGTKTKYQKHFKGYDLSCRQKFKLPLSELIKKDRKTKEERDFLKKFDEYMPVINSECVMNNLCKYIESIDFRIKDRLKKTSNVDICYAYTDSSEMKDKNTYNSIKKAYRNFKSKINEQGNMNNFNHQFNKRYNGELGETINSQYSDFVKLMNSLCSNEKELIDYLIYLFYIDIPSSNKDLLWNTYGKVIYGNVKNKTNSPILFPLPDDNGEIAYLNKRFKLKEVVL